MCPAKRRRVARTRRSTPNGEAQNVLDQAAGCLRELTDQRTARNPQRFVRRLNDFLTTARKVPEFLPKELGRQAGLKAWVKTEDARMLAGDRRYAHFTALRNVSSHDCIVQPDHAQQTVQVTSEMRISGHAEIELHDAETGRTAVARGVYDGPVGAESFHRETKVRTTYYFADWPNEDIVTFCREILATLNGLVVRAYRHFP
jgi:hypothetical protein